MKKYKITLNWATYINSDDPNEDMLKELAKQEFDNLLPVVCRHNFEVREADVNSKEYKKLRIEHDAQALANFAEKSGIKEITFDLTGETLKKRRFDIL